MVLVAHSPTIHNSGDNACFPITVIQHERRQGSSAWTLLYRADCSERLEYPDAVLSLVHV